MFPVAVTEERSLITRAMGDTLSFLPLCFSLAEGITLEGYSKQKTSLYILNYLQDGLLSSGKMHEREGQVLFPSSLSSSYLKPRQGKVTAILSVLSSLPILWVRWNTKTNYKELELVFREKSERRRKRACRPNGMISTALLSPHFIHFANPLEKWLTGRQNLEVAI